MVKYKLKKLSITLILDITMVVIIHTMDIIVHTIPHMFIIEINSQDKKKLNQNLTKIK